MKRSDFSYHLPESLIAKMPAQTRTGSRLMQLDGPSGDVNHGLFIDMLDLIEPGDLLVFNDTRVIPARVYGKKATGGRIEVLVERVLGTHSVIAQIRSSKSPKAGSMLILDGDVEAEVVGRHDAMFELHFKGDEGVLSSLERVGHMPLPPYIDRDDGLEDRNRYQTVYGKNLGAVAAPTAGLHFDDALLAALKAKGVEFAFVTLHVGAGTYQPVRVDDIRDHKIHTEIMALDAATAEQVNATKAKGKRVIAVGTTSVRCLETAARNSSSSDVASNSISNSANSNLASDNAATKIEAYQGETNIFIYPSYKYRVVDALFTNFHLSESTLLMLVSAFAGYAHTMAAYKMAVDQAYRFFSYGDSMFITRNPNAEHEPNAER